MLKSAVGIIVRNEAEYIEECILFNHLIGFDHILIGCDRCEDETYERATQLQKYLPHLTVFEVTPTESELSRGENSCWYQRAGYRHIALQLHGQVEWLAMFDCDEYLWNKDYRKINDLLEEIPSHINQIRIPWLFFGHNNQVVSAPKSRTRLEWFTKRQPFTRQEESKVIFRLNCLTHEKWWDGHFIRERNVVGNTISFSGKQQPPYGFYWHGSLETEPVMLCHYFAGAMEDWVRRYKRRPYRGNGLLHDLRMFLSHGWDIEDSSRMQPYAEELKTLLKEYCVE